MNTELIKTKYGYLSVKNLPTQEELEKHYTDKYYQNESTQYAHDYSQDELKYFNNTAEVAEFIYYSLFKSKNKNLLEVGIGEGFFANYFLNNKWNVTTMDYSDYGIKNHNPLLLNSLIQGDIFKSLDKLVLQNNTFDLINLSNLLEHAIDPIDLLEKLKALLSNESLLRISVPNDYSNFQKFLLEKEYSTNTWLSPPDHLHYFTFDSLTNLLSSLGYEVAIKIGEFPIELYLSNEFSNYVKNKDRGKFAHKSIVEVDNFLFKEGIKKYINFYKACADIGLSRQVVIFARLKV